MNSAIPPEGFSIERLDKSLHERDGFSCGKPELDNFLRTQAAQDQSKHLGATHVLCEIGDQNNARRKVVGYLTLATGNIPLADCPESIKKLTRMPNLPILLLGRMAVDHRYKGNRLGEFLLKYALTLAVEISDRSGCLAVVVDAKDDEAKNFYLRYGFLELPERKMTLLLPMQTIKKLFV